MSETTVPASYTRCNMTSMMRAGKSPSNLFAFDGEVFMPDQYHDDHIQTGHDRQEQRMVERYPVYLISDEDAEKRDRSQIGPESLPQQLDGKENTCRPVSDQIHSAEHFRICCDVLHGVPEQVSHNVMRVFDQLLLGEKENNPYSRAFLYRQSKKPTRDLESAVDSLCPDADVEHAVEKILHGNRLISTAPLQECSSHAPSLSEER
jgi:hypothetical protein